MDGRCQISEFGAAQYVRMSTGHQQYSSHNQSDKILKHAERPDIQTIKTYADYDRSDLSIKKSRNMIAPTLTC